MSRFAKGQKRIERARATHPYLAIAPTSLCPLTAHRHGACIVAETDRGIRTFAFRKKRAADQFVANVDSAVHAGGPVSEK